MLFGVVFVGLSWLWVLNRGDRPPSARHLRGLLETFLESERSSSVCVDLLAGAGDARAVGTRNLLAALEVGWIEVPSGISAADLGELPTGYRFELSAAGRDHLVQRVCGTHEMGVPDGLKFRDTQAPRDDWVPLRVRRRVVSSILKVTEPVDWRGDRWITVYYDVEVSEITALGKQLGYQRSPQAAFSGLGAEVTTLRFQEGRWTPVGTGYMGLPTVGW